MGTTLRELICDVGEGVANEKAFKAAQIGGPSGGCLPEAALDIPIDFDSLQEAGAIMGSGGWLFLTRTTAWWPSPAIFLNLRSKSRAVNAPSAAWGRSICSIF